MLLIWLQVEEEEEAGEDGQVDPQAAERRRLREAEEWRLQQLRSGVSPSDNSNFQVREQRHPMLSAPLSADTGSALLPQRGVLAHALASAVCAAHIRGFARLWQGLMSGKGFPMSPSLSLHMEWRLQQLRPSDNSNFQVGGAAHPTPRLWFRV